MMTENADHQKKTVTLKAFCDISGYVCTLGKLPLETQRIRNAILRRANDISHADKNKVRFYDQYTALAIEEHRTGILQTLHNENQA